MIKSLLYFLCLLTVLISCSEHKEKTSVSIENETLPSNNFTINGKSWQELELSDNADTSLATYTYRILFTEDSTNMYDCTIRQNLIESSPSIKKLLPLLFYPKIDSTVDIDHKIDSLNNAIVTYAKNLVDQDQKEYGIIAQGSCYDLWKKNIFTLSDAKSLIDSIKNESSETEIDKVIYQIHSFYPCTDSILDYIIKNDKNYTSINGCIGLPTSLSYEFYHLFLNNSKSINKSKDSLIIQLDNVILRNKKILKVSKSKDSNIALLEDSKKLRLLEYALEHKKNRAFIPPSLEVDDYPITNNMLQKANTVKEPVLWFDGVWFSHQDQTIAIALSTDYYRHATFHFLNNDIPLDLLKTMELHTPEHKIADLTTKKELITETFPKINELESSYFITKKGIKLGDHRSKIFKLYNKPDSTKTHKDVSISYWSFIGDTFYMEQDLKGKPLAKNSYGHTLKMYFRKEKLIGLIMYNDIP